MPPPGPPTYHDESEVVEGRCLVTASARRLGPVHEHIIDGERWIANRLAFLRERLAGEPDVEERLAVEAEIEALSKERGLTPGGVRTSRFGRWLRRKA